MNIQKSYLSLVIVSVILIILILYNVSLQLTNDDPQKGGCCIHRINTSFVFDNLTKNFYLKIGPIINENKKPVDGANAEISMNNTLFNCTTDKNGYANFTIPSEKVSITKLSGTYSVTFTKEGFDKLELEITINYKP